VSYYTDGWAPYVSVAERRRKAEKAAAKAAKGGTALSPINPSRGALTKTFWGRAWCDNLERYSDYANRLPRGRTYVRNGSVIDLQVGAGKVDARVMGSSLYKVTISVTAVPPALWQAISTECATSIASLVELLQGRLSKAVMERICRPGTGLFPAPRDITLHCSCPDSARMCKHVAAALYGVGARLDQQPQLLFQLRGVDAKDLVTQAGAAIPQSGPGPAAGKRLDDTLLGDVFGIEMDEAHPPAPRLVTQPPAPAVAPKQATAAPKKLATGAKKVASLTKNSADPAKRIEVAKVARPATTAKAVKAAKAAKAITPDWVFKLPTATPTTPRKATAKPGSPARGKPKTPTGKTARAAAPSTGVQSTPKPNSIQRV
jgi:uncharacterized Zn finger protein